MFVTRYRPKALAQIIGSEQKRAAEFLEKSVREKAPVRSVLLMGASGLGKTTIARMYASLIVCDNPRESKIGLVPCGECGGCRSVASIEEINCSADTGIDFIRRRIETLYLLPMESRYKVFILDEVHGLSKQAQNALLKPIEDAPDHVVFILCTTETTGIIDTLRSRCQEFRFGVPNRNDMVRLVSTILKIENMDVNQNIIDDLIDSSGGNIRRLVQNAEQSNNFVPVDENVEKEEFLARRLIYSLAQSKNDFQEIVGLAKNITDFNREIASICSYCISILSGKNTNQNIENAAVVVLKQFGDGLPSSAVPKFAFVKRIVDSYYEYERW